MPHTTSKHGGKNAPTTPPKRYSSHGDSPVEMTPKDVSPKHAAWKDRTKRHTTSDDAEERADALLDEASDLSFPASDPIAVSSVTKIVKEKKDKKSTDEQDK